MLLIFVAHKMILTRIGAACLLLCALLAPTQLVRAQQPTLVLQTGQHPNALAMRPDGQVAVTGGYDGLLKWWDRKTGLLIRTIVAHRGVVSTLGFSSDGSQLLSGGEDGYIRIWESSRGTKLSEFHAVPGLMKYAVFNLRGNLIASCSLVPENLQATSHVIHIWDAHTGRLLNKLQGHSKQVNYLDFNRAGDALASVSDDHTVRIWSLETGRLVNTIRANSSGEFVMFSPDGLTIATTSSSPNPARSELVFFDARSGGRVSGFTDDEYWYGTSLSANWRYFVATTAEQVKVWDVASKQLVRSEQVKGEFSAVVLDEEGSTAAFAGQSSPIFWPTNSPYQPHAQAPSLNSTTGLSFNSNKTVSWGSGNRIYIWDSANATLAHVLKAHSDAVNEVAFSRDGRMMASCSNQEVKLWSIPDYKSIGDLTPPKPNNVEEYNWNGSQSVAFSPDGKYLATGEIRVTTLPQNKYVETLGIRLWNIATRQMRLFKLPEFNDPEVPDPDGQKDPPYWIHSIAFSPDGRMIAADNGSNRILLLDVHSGRALSLRGHERPINSIAFSADGKRLVSAGFDRTIRLWNVSNGRLLRTFTGHQGRVTSVRFSPDGRTIVSGSRDRTAKVWDVNTGENITTLENHDEAVTSVGFSPDGKTIFTAGLDGKINLWSTRIRNLKVTVVADSDNSWVCFSPEGYYEGNNPERFIGWRTDTSMYPAITYQAQFSLPSQVVAKMNEIPLIVQSSQPIPNLSPPPVSPGWSGDVRVRGTNGTTRSVQVYKRSYAILIGNTEYANWNNLPGVLQDMIEVRDALKRQGFGVVKFSDRGDPIFDQPALNLTRDEFKRQINLFIDQYGQDEENRLLIYYAGHGYTALLPDGRKMGYLVMRDAPRMPHVDRPLKPLTAPQLAPLYRAAVNMDEIETYARNILSRHVMFVFDSCFAGTVLFRGDEPEIPPYITAEVMQPVRAFLTAGLEYQEVPDESVFRKAFVRGIEGAADGAYGNNPRDGYVLASELAVYIKQEVGTATRGRQTPVFGKIPTQELARGDFVFVYGQGQSNR
jgi:WD40 repeat protein